MAKTDNTVTVPQKSNRRTYWCASMYSNDADTSSSVEVKAAPTTGSLYLERVMVICDQDPSTITIQDGSNALFGPWEMTATEYGGMVDIKLTRVVKLSGALNIVAGANAPVFVLAEGYTEA